MCFSTHHVFARKHIISETTSYPLADTSLQNKKSQNGFFYFALVEAAGIEPASELAITNFSTRLVNNLTSPFELLLTKFH